MKARMFIEQRNRAERRTLRFIVHEAKELLGVVLVGMTMAWAILNCFFPNEPMGM